MPSSLASHYRPHALNTLYEALGTSVVPNSCDLVVLAGVLNHERLRTAIAATLARHPVLSGKPFTLRFHVLAVDDPARVDAHLLDLIWNERLASDQAPVRFHVTVVAGRSYFQTIHTHVYADATACYLLTEQIAASYGTRFVPAAPVSSTPIATPAKLTTARRVAQRIRGIAQTARDLRTPFGGLATAPRSAAGRRRLARFVLTPSETDQLRQAARRRGCSIHALFQLAFLRTAVEFNRHRGVERPHLRLWDFFSMRPLRNDPTPRYDCLALVYPVDLDARHSDEQILAQCTDTIAQLRGGDIFSHAFRFDTLFSLFGPMVSKRWFAQLWPSLFKSNILLTNPGIVPSTLSSFGEVPVVDYVTFPQLFYPAEVMLVFSTFRGSLRVLAVYEEEALGATFHEALFMPFLREVGDLAGLDLSLVNTGDGFVAQWEAQAPRERMSA